MGAHSSVEITRETALRIIHSKLYELSDDEITDILDNMFDNHLLRFNIGYEDEREYRNGYFYEKNDEDNDEYE